MHDVHLGTIDLNLLRVLSALVAEENVTRAGVRLGLSQSAMSHALARAREAFDDAILVRAEGRMVATERARVLARAITSGLSNIELALEGSTHFQPSQARRTFTLAMNDYAELVMLPALLRTLREVAPGVDLWVLNVGERLSEALAAGTAELAVGLLSPIYAQAGISHEALFDDDFVCVMRAGHPLADKPLTVARYCNASHLLVAPRGERGSFVDDALRELGKSRRVALAVPHFLVAPHLVAASDLIATLARRVAQSLVAPLSLVTLRPPLPLGLFTIAQLWHPRTHGDPGLVWLREQLRVVAASLDGARR